MRMITEDQIGQLKSLIAKLERPEKYYLVSMATRKGVEVNKQAQDEKYKNANPRFNVQDKLLTPYSATNYLSDILPRQVYRDAVDEPQPIRAYIAQRQEVFHNWQSEEFQAWLNEPEDSDKQLLGCGGLYVFTWVTGSMLALVDKQRREAYGLKLNG